MMYKQENIEECLQSTGGSRLNAREQKAVTMWANGASIVGISRGLGLPVDHLFEILGLSKDVHQEEYLEAKSERELSGTNNPLRSSRSTFVRADDSCKNPFIKT